MFQFALLLLLCTPAISSHRPDLFRGCVPTSENHRKTPHACIVVPTSELSTHGAFYTKLAESVLQKPSNQLQPKFLNTVYNVTRAAVKYPGHLNVGATLRMEFLTARSGCLHRPYSVYVCPPVDEKANGLCQASFTLYGSAFVLERSWCKPTG
ncbi:uncharacterized protein LOC142765524 [Rhipicephalus microplus]|uniref:uncharacterized protein LOC142765524 n=1 Tax=Rhipicephalus microplus TaxID=6941 RepID=UPI003F6D48BB